MVIGSTGLDSARKVNPGCFLTSRNELRCDLIDKVLKITAAPQIAPSPYVHKSCVWLTVKATVRLFIDHSQSF